MGNEMKHTPGPWKVCDGDARLVALPGIVKPIPCGNVANARLIAAAPETAAERDALRAQNAELREALQAALRHAYELNELVYSGEHVADDSAVAIIRAALKSCGEV